MRGGRGGGVQRPPVVRARRPRAARPAASGAAFGARRRRRRPPHLVVRVVRHAVVIRQVHLRREGRGNAGSALGDGARRRPATERCGCRGAPRRARSAARGPSHPLAARDGAAARRAARCGRVAAGASPPRQPATPAAGGGTRPRVEADGRGGREVGANLEVGGVVVREAGGGGALGDAVGRGAQHLRPRQQRRAQQQQQRGRHVNDRQRAGGTRRAPRRHGR